MLAQSCIKHATHTNEPFAKRQKKLFVWNGALMLD